MLDRLEIIPLGSRTFFTVKGEDAPSFLQGLLTVDTVKMAPGALRYTLMLSPQGKLLFDGFITRAGEHEFLIDTDEDRRSAFMAQLHKYKLRSRVQLGEWDGVAVSLSHQIDIPGHCMLAADPRLSALGYRLTGPRIHIMPWLAAHEVQDAAAYDVLRYEQAVAEGKDMIAEKSFPLEYGLDQLHAVDYAKGCYVGQEVTARTHYRGVIRKFIHTVYAAENIPPPGTKVIAHQREIGEIRATAGGKGLALMRLAETREAQEQHIPLLAGDVTIQVSMPRWAQLSVVSSENAARAVQE